MECTVCYDRMGEIDKAERCNGIAVARRPDSQAVRYNRACFEARRAQKRT